MRSIIRWSVDNAPAINTLMVSVIGVGIVGLVLLRRELFPEFNLDIIQISVPYPGASPAEVEEGICQKIEEAVRSVAGIKKIHSVALEGAGVVILELKSSVRDPQRVLNEVRSEVDRISTFPELAEDPVVKQLTFRRAAIRVGVIGPVTDDPDAEFKLREVAEQLRQELLMLPSVSQAEIIGRRDYQIDVEISEKTLRKYGLTLAQVAEIIRRQNVELPGGVVKASSQEILIRGKGKYLRGAEIAKLPVLTLPDGVVLTVGDLGTVRDGFVDTTSITRINGQPGMVISVDKTAEEDLLVICREVRDFISKINTDRGFQLPPGYKVTYWFDESVPVADRLRLLTKNGIQGLIVVFVLLAAFLELRLAFWVAMGLPVAMLGTCAVLWLTGQSINMLSMFAFLIGLGILVDDAIVVSENIHAHRQLFGKSFARAAVDGTYEVIPSVSASVATTIIAFMPLLFVPGEMGKFFAIVPRAVISMLVLSWLEALFILPCHLGHDPEHGPRFGRRIADACWRWWSYLHPAVAIAIALAAVLIIAGEFAGTYDRLLQSPSFAVRFWGALGYVATVPAAGVVAIVAILAGRQIIAFTRRFNRWFGSFFDFVVTRVYRPTISWAVSRPFLTSAIGLACLLAALGFVRGGYVPFNPFPKLDSNYLYAQVRFPDGTPASVTSQATERLEKAIWQLNEELSPPGKSIVKVTHRSVGEINISGAMVPLEEPGGSHVGGVFVEIIDASERDIKSTELVNRWREVAGQFPGAESVQFQSFHAGPGGAAIEFKLLAPVAYWQQLEQAAELCKAKLAEYPGVFDIADDSRPGKWEFQIKLKDRAKALGITLADVAETVRGAVYGHEVMRLQRGRNEVKLMVRYPPEERYSPFNLNEIRIRGRDGIERPLPELAEVQVRRGYSAINRSDQLRSITITADVDEAVANADRIIRDLKQHFFPELLAKPEFRNIRVSWEGMQEMTRESVTGLQRGLMIALVAMFVLLTVEFRSYTQPLIIMAIIPFGAIGAVLGHWLMGYELTLLSLFGLVALTGVVVNDSIVLIDFINRSVRAGDHIDQALVEAGCRRLRPIMLTSLTTIGGLSPLMLERSFQAQFLIPMAISLCFGLAVTTVLVPILVPVFYKLYYLAWTKLTGGRPATAKFEDAVRKLEELEQPIEEAISH